jgi:hypothetical protein
MPVPTVMSANLIEWTVRMAMLVLAGLVTLAILGSIAAMSNDAATVAPAASRGTAAVEAAPQPLPAPPAEAVPAVPPAAPGAARRDPSPGAPAIAAGAAPPSSPGDDAERWLEAIAYGLLALAGLFAIGLVLLWRGLWQLGRIADALEARPRR